MTRREAVIRALRHEETPILPYHVEFTSQEAEKMARATGDPAFASKCGGFLHYMQYWGYPTEREKGSERFTDDFGVTWNRSGADKDIGVIDAPVISEPDLSLYPTPFLNEARIRPNAKGCYRPGKTGSASPGSAFPSSNGSGAIPAWRMRSSG